MQFNRHLGRVGLAVAIGVQLAVSNGQLLKVQLQKVSWLAWKTANCKLPTVNCQLRTATNKADATYYLCTLIF
jgi:hypothetical protein